MIATITALYIYPIKSCRGISLDRATIGATGFAHDREWLVVQGDRFVTQREQPRLALVTTALSAHELRVSAPGMEDLTLDLRAADGEAREVTCWKDRCAAFDGGSQAARWFSMLLDAPSHLVRFDPRRKRVSNRQWTGDIEALNQFTDGYPWSLASESSLAELNSRLEQPLPMNRFRPNIVVRGLPAYAEDRIHELAGESVRLRAVKPCDRCIVTTTDQDTAQRTGPEPLKTLRSYRFSAQLKGVLFAQNLVLVEGVGRELRVGDALEVGWKPE